MKGEQTAASFDCIATSTSLTCKATAGLMGTLAVAAFSRRTRRASLRIFHTARFITEKPLTMPLRGTERVQTSGASRNLDDSGKKLVDFDVRQTSLTCWGLPRRSVR